MKKLLKISLASIMIFGLAGCAKTDEQEPSPSTSEVSQAKRQGIDYLDVEVPQTTRENDVISAEEWKSVLPDVYETYMGNKENDEAVQYLETSPYLVELYEGFGFSKDYKSARGHSYTLEDVNETLRPHALANCLTCKTADYTALVNKMGSNAYSLDFAETYEKVSENVGCYTCHENKAGNQGELVLTHDYTANIASNLANDKIELDTSTCGQCHTEYYFDGQNNKATSIPYTDKASMTPEAELAFYDAMDFADWTQESTGAKLLKVQHPEFETFVGSVHQGMGLSCADCHMATKTSAGGRVYIDHTLVSPLQSKEILETCASCHQGVDMVQKVTAIQQEITAREDEVGKKLVELKNELVKANASDNYTEDELNNIRKLYRSALWFFDYDYVENSEGAHNSALARKCLDTAEDYYNQAMALFK